MDRFKEAVAWVVDLLFGRRHRSRSRVLTFKARIYAERSQHGMNLVELACASCPWRAYAGTAMGMRAAVEAHALHCRGNERREEVTIRANLGVGLDCGQDEYARESRAT